MLIVKQTVETIAPASAVWNVWQDVSNWNTWDHGIEFSTIDGPFVVGTKGTLKPKGGPLVQTLLTCVEPPRQGRASFVDESKLPFAKIIVSHFLEELNEKTIVTHQIEICGFLAPLFAVLIGRKMKKNILQEMMSLVTKAETLNKKS